MQWEILEGCRWHGQPLQGKNEMRTFSHSNSSKAVDTDTCSPVPHTQHKQGNGKGERQWARPFQKESLEGKGQSPSLAIGNHPGQIPLPSDRSWLSMRPKSCSWGLTSQPCFPWALGSVLWDALPPPWPYRWGDWGTCLHWLRGSFST